MTPSKTRIKQLLAESSFDPRSQGPMKVVVSMGDSSYCESKAIELISEAKTLVSNADQYNEKIAKAVSLLALARALRETPILKKKK